MTFPRPDFGRPNYSTPSAYVGVDPTYVGHSAQVDQIVATFSSTGPEQRLAEIARWIRSNLQCDNDTTQYFWRNADDVIARCKYVGCADYALVFGSFARASSIPTIWVKSLKLDWIRRYHATRHWDGGDGHVFLEVFVNNRWALLDPQSNALDLYEQYVPAHELLPGGLFAYDKGGHPRELLLSIDWEPWVRQTKDYFGGFEIARLDSLKPATEGLPRKLLSNPHL